MNKKIIVGVDIGGTNVKLGLVSAQGRIACQTSFSTKGYIRNKKELIRAVIDKIQSLFDQKYSSSRKIAGIGVGLPGLVNPVKGIVKFLPNIPGWRNVPLADIIQQKIKVPVFIENDVNLIALAEWKFGAGSGVRNMLCMTLGTGVGGGLILNNQLYRGEGYVAGEIGHIPIEQNGLPCNCGGWGCLERYVGNRQLQATAAEVLHEKGITLEDVCARAAQGDPLALKFWDETAVTIGNALTGIVNVLNPTRIVIGGGVANASRFMFKTIEKTIKQRSMHVQGAMVKIVKARLGHKAGVMGAAVLVMDALRHKGVARRQAGL